MNATDSSHYLYISGGTGTAEAVLIAGGTAVGGAASGTVIVTCANTHSGAWTVRSASGGLAEAIVMTGGTGKVVITTIITAYAPIIISSGSIHIQGTGINFSDKFILRDSSFATGPIIRVSGAGVVLQLSDLFISAGSSAAAYAAVQVDTSATLTARNIYISNAIYGLIADGAGSVDVDGFSYVNSSSNVAASGVQIGPTGQSNIRLSNATIVAPAGSLAKLTNCISILAVDGAHLHHLILSGQSGISFSPTGSQFVANTDIDDFEIDSFLWQGIAFTSSPTTPVIAVNISNGNINAQHAGSAASVGIDLGYSWANVKADNLTFRNLKIYDTRGDGVHVGALANIPKAIEFSDLQIFNPNVAASSYAGFRIAAGASGVRVRNSTIGNRGYGLTGASYAGFLLDGAVTDTILTGNDVASNTYPILLGGTFAGWMEDNHGIDDVTGTATSGSTMALPPNATIAVSGTTGVGTLTGLWEGRKVTLITTGGTVTFTAGSTIGNSITSVQNVPMTGVVSGNKLYLK